MESSQITLKIDALSTQVKNIPIKLRQMNGPDVEIPKKNLEAVDELVATIRKELETLKLHTLQNYEIRNKVEK